jgi:hypothetical protein
MVREERAHQALTEWEAIRDLGVAAIVGLTVIGGLAILSEQEQGSTCNLPLPQGCLMPMGQAEPPPPATEGWFATDPVQAAPEAEMETLSAGGVERIVLFLRAE